MKRKIRQQQRPQTDEHEGPSSPDKVDCEGITNKIKH